VRFAGNIGTFGTWWLGTLALGAAFLYGTANEWHRLIYVDGLTIQHQPVRNTYYSLVGLQRVSRDCGLLCLSIVMGFTLLEKRKTGTRRAREVLSLYWHFVDAVWIVVFLVVYVIGR